jgi:hypothetical protein
MTRSMDEPSPFLIRENGDTLRIAWDNRRVHKANAVFWIFIVFWIIWAPGTLLATVLFICAIFRPGIGIVLPFFLGWWCIFGWLGTLGIPYCLIGRTWSEWIEISPEAISYGCIGFLARKAKTFPLDTIIELGCGLRGYGDGTDQESMVTLNIMRSGGFLGNPRRYLFGYWLATTLKVEVFETIEQFVTVHQIPLKMKRYSPLFVDSHGTMHGNKA